MTTDGRRTSSIFLRSTTQKALKGKNVRNNRYNEVILALSGGVDSSVLAVLLHQAIGKQLHCIFVDNGLLRKNEFTDVLESYKDLGLNVIGVDASSKFYAELDDFQICF